MTEESRSPHTHSPLRACDAAQTLSRLIQNTQQLRLRSPSLDSLNGDKHVCEAIKHLALRSDRPVIWILFDDIGDAVKQGHRLIHLSRRLPSRIQLRQSNKDDHNDNQWYALGDSTRLFEAPGWPQPRHLQHYASHIPRGPQRKQQFQDEWERSRGCAELRELRL